MTWTWCYRIAFSVPLICLCAKAARAEESMASLRGEEARFRAAERLLQQKRYPQAADAYQQILMIHEGGRHQRQIIDRLYAIAFYWLQDSWDQLRQINQFHSPDWLLWFYPSDVYSEVLPRTRDIFEQALRIRRAFHWDKSKPFLGEEGRAVGVLQLISKRDPAGPYADKALFLIGHIGWFREDYRQADECFSRLYKKHPRSKYVQFALELAIKAKLMHIDEEEADYWRQLGEAREMIRSAQHRQDISEERKESLLKLLVGINVRQAEVVFKTAEERQLAGEMEQAYSRYDLVRREYPGTYAALQATERMMILRPKLPKDFKLTPVSRSDR